MSPVIAASGLHISLLAEEIIKIGPISISNSLLAAVLTSIIIAVLFIMSARKVAVKPSSKFAGAVEALCDVLVNMIQNVVHSRDKAIKFFPLLTTLFVFILLNNWFGLLPIVGPLTVQGEHGPVPLLRGSNADLNGTLALALISVIMTQVYAFRELGVKAQLSKYFSKNPILSFVGLLEIIGEFSKMISFSFRLFGNIFAGEVLLVVISSLVPVGASLPFFGLELFVGLVQALVFTMLSLVFLGIASSHHGGHEETSHDRSSEAQPAS